MALPNNLTTNPTLDRWVSVAPDGAVTIRSGKVELGQGIGGAMILIAASELGLPPERIRLGATDTGLAPAEGITAGSLSIEHGGSAMRVACAMVRDLFVEAAEAALGGKVDLSAGVFSVPGTNRVAGYGDLADKVDLSVSALDRPEPVLVGEGDGAPDYRRPDLPAKLSGAGFIQDIRLPGQVFGRVLRPEAPWLRLVSFDVEAIRAMPGVLAVVQDGAFAGVVAFRDDQAVAAVEKARRSAVWEGAQAGPAWDEDQSWLEAADLPADRLREDGQPLARCSA
jgi:nicotinate dehydrogenase subunit B